MSERDPYEDLFRERPAPSPGFADELRRRLLELDAGGQRPANLWALVAVCAFTGIALLVIAVVGVGV